jgi:glycine cleavage system H protein
MAPAQDFSIPSDIKLCQTHEYIRADEDDRARVGISHYAAEQLGDVVYIELPELGQVIEAGETFGSIESVKAASDLYMPVTGEIVAVNTQLTSEPELINDDCYGDGWMIEIALSNKDELDSLMPPKQYVKFLEESGDS